MNCDKCGAPLVLHRERDYYHCEHCGAFYFPNSSPDGTRVLGENPEGIKCSLCQIPFNMVTFDDHYRGYQCSRCQGILFTRTTFRETIETRRARATTPPEPPSRYDQKEMKRRLNCPICTREMSAHYYMGPGNIVVDTCNHCDVIWLDYGELGRVVNAPGRDRGIGVRDQKELHWEEAKKQRKKKSKKKRTKLDRGLLELLDHFFS